MSEEKFDFNAGPEMNACVSEMGELLEKWQARAVARPEEADGFLVVHVAVLQAYAMWFTREVDSRHDDNIRNVRTEIFDALNEPETEEVH